jgi:hypothetical protein
MRLIVAGSRTFSNKEKVFKNLDNIYKHFPELEIVSGLAKGPDSFGKQWAAVNRVPCHEFPANWDKYGKRAGFVRNEEMAHFGDAALIYWDGKSPGSKSMIKLANEAGLKVAVVYY